VSASYRTLKNVIDDVSLQVRKGDTMAVVGESGSGKSTLARVVVGLLAAGVGRCEVQGREACRPMLHQRSKEQLRRMQMIYQMRTSPSIRGRRCSTSSVVRVVLLRPFRRRRKARVLELLRQIDLPEHFIDRLPGGCRAARSSVSASPARSPPSPS